MIYRGRGGGPGRGAGSEAISQPVTAMFLSGYHHHLRPLLPFQLVIV